MTDDEAAVIAQGYVEIEQEIERRHRGEPSTGLMRFFPTEMLEDSQAQFVHDMNRPPLLAMMTGHHAATAPKKRDHETETA